MFKAKYYNILLLIFLFGCNSDEFSPNQKFNSSTPTHVNAREISALPTKVAGSSIKIAVSGDT